MSGPILPAKYASASLKARFDFLADMGGDTISSASCQAFTYSGLDGNPSALISGAASFIAFDQSVFQSLTGGLAGCTYIILCNVITNSGRTFTQHAFLAVLPDNFS